MYIYTHTNEITYTYIYSDRATHIILADSSTAPTEFSHLFPGLHVWELWISQTAVPRGSVLWEQWISGSSGCMPYRIESLHI